MERRYAIELLPSAVRELEKLPRDPRARVLEAIDSLQIEPRPPGARLLSGTGRERIWRVQVGQYRVLYRRIGIRRLLRDMPFAKDVLVASVADLQHPIGGTAVSAALREGVVVYER